jgi:hypothetical protein
MHVETEAQARYADPDDGLSGRAIAQAGTQLLQAARS